MTDFVRRVESVVVKRGMSLPAICLAGLTTGVHNIIRPVAGPLINGSTVSFYQVLFPR